MAKKNEQQRLREFGLMMCLVMTGFNLLFAYKGNILGVAITLVLLAFFGLMGLLRPKGLLLVERAWLAFGERLGRVMTCIILSLTFYLVITPVGLIRRLLVGDPLGINFEKTRASYWVKAEKTQDKERYYLPY